MAKTKKMPSRGYKPLFSFGSNTPEQVEERLDLRGKDRTHFLNNAAPAFLPKHGRVFRGMSRNWGGGTASVIKDADRTVYGYVSYLKESDLRILDRREGALMAPPKYKRVIETVWVQDYRSDDFIPIKAYLYKSTSRQFNEPTRAYLKAIVKMLNQFWSGKGGKKVKMKDIGIS